MIMKDIKEIQRIVAEFIDKQDFGGNPHQLYDPVEYTIRQSGKRIRPTLCLLACDLFGGDIEKALYPAIATEVFHNFTLIHDDIMDKAPIRRGKETVYKKWNSNIAILSGDVMLTMAFRYALNTDKDCAADMLDSLCRVSTEICEGQQFDLNFETQPEVSIDEYLEMIRLKTAVLLGTALKMGAIAAHASQENKKAIYDFGIALGMAFQLQDDLLDCYGDAKVFGKAIGGDIVENKKTFMCLKALEKAESTDRERLASILAGKTTFADNALKIKEVLALYDKYGIRQEAENLMTAYYNKALEILDSVDAPQHGKSVLCGYAESLYGRNK